MKKKMQWEPPGLISLRTEDPSMGVCQVGSINPTGSKCQGGGIADGSQCHPGGSARGHLCKEGAYAAAPRCKFGSHVAPRGP
jgi:hypothetical protein